MIEQKGRRTMVLLAGAVSAVALIAAACSSSKPSASSSGTSGTTTASTASASSNTSSVGAASSGGGGATPSGTGNGPTGAWYNEAAKQASGTPFKLGYIYEPGLLQASPNLTVNALRSWIDWQNAHNGINGHPIQLTVKQDPGNPGVARTEVQSLVSDHVTALIDGDGADDAGWASYIVTQPQVSLYINGFDSEAMASSTHQFSTTVSQYYLPDEIMLAAKKVGGHKMAVLYCAETPACSQTVAPLKTVGNSLGIPVVFDASILSSAPNYTAQCLAARAAGADVMFIADGPAPTLAAASSCAQQGYTPHQVSDEAAYGQQMAGQPGWNGFLGTQDNIPFYTTSTPGSKTMHDAMMQYEPSVLTDRQYSVGEVLEWTTGLLIAAGAEQGGVGTTNPMTGQALTAGVYALHSTNLGGMTPTLTFVQGQPQENHCWFWAGIQSGKFNLPFGETTTCAAALPASTFKGGA